MYNGVNPTALQSQQWLSDSLIALMEEKPFSRITVLNICKRADLSRQTFYNFFQSKEELLRFCLQQKYEEQFQKYRSRQTLSVSEIVEAFSSVLIQNKTMLSSMIQNGLDGILFDEVSKCISLFANQFVSIEKDNALLPYSEVLLSGALAHLLVYWFKQENPIPLDQLTNLLMEFFRGQLYEVKKD